MPDVICAGLIVADHVSAPIERLPVSGELVLADRLEVTIGGCGANTACDLARLGVNVSLAGLVGDDVLGRFCRDFLESRGVNCDLVATAPSAQTAATLIVNVRGEDRRFIHAVGANADFTGASVTPAALDRAKVLCIGGFGLNAALSGSAVARLFQQARERRVTTVLDVVIGDPSPVVGMLRESLPYADVFLPNRDEAKLITGLDDPWAQARRFREWGARTVIITAGREGCFALSAEIESHIPAFAVQQVDGTGGGDAFVAGFIFGLLEGASLKQCLRFGAALGASCVQAVGATTGGFNREQLERFVEDHPV
jgi:sugar/nucleoside kinase (ribokinase family)